jgi:hypothetical protein
MKTTTSLMGALAVALLLFGAPVVQGAEMPTAEAVASAKTAAEHNAIADAYAAEAKDLRAKAAMHEAMLKSYDTGPGYLKQKSGLVAHCKALINMYESAAKDLEALAEDHRKMAMAAGGK